MAAVLFLTAFSLISCRNKKIEAREAVDRKAARSAHQFVIDSQNKKESAVDDFIKSLSLQEKISQLFLINLEGNEKFYFVEMQDGRPLVPGGYIFFSFNISDNPETIIGFTNSVKEFAYSKNIVPPYLTLDAEGGYVNRLRKIAGALPENARVAECISSQKAYELYSMNAVQLKSLGFELNLSPVAEIVTDDNASFLDGRGYGDKSAVSEYGKAAVSAYENNGVGSVVKHFPGNSNVDPHIGLPRIEFDKSFFEDDLLYAFKNVLEAKPSAVLMSHAICTISQSDRMTQSGGAQKSEGVPLSGAEMTPSCLSEFWVNDVLRNQLSFDGLVFSDDIFMAALEKNGYPPELAVRMALRAGIDCIMMSEKRFINEYMIVRRLYGSDLELKSKIDKAIRRIICWKISKGILEYVYDGGNISVRISEIPDSDIERKQRLIQFKNERTRNTEFYEKYFLPTADKSELRAVGRL